MLIIWFQSGIRLQRYNFLLILPTISAKKITFWPKKCIFLQKSPIFVGKIKEKVVILQPLCEIYLQ